ncbi:MAG: hypothetical protein M0002_05495 [Rhodospirillales bacterium]|nr:hypothetical protein [Rhodospirillales bacterium]
MVSVTDRRPQPATNRVKEKLAAGKLVLCIATRQARTPDIPMMADAAGFDSFYIDMEHSSITLDTAGTVCVAALGIGITRLVRVAGHAARCR